MRHIRRIAIIAAAILFCCIWGKGQKAYAKEVSGEIEVIMPLEEDEIRPYIDTFEKKYPKVSVRYTYYKDYETDLKLRMEQGGYGDVFLIPEFMTEEDLEKYAEPFDSQQALSQKYRFLEQSRRKNGLVYAIPCYAYLSGIIYNKEVFDKAGIVELPTTMKDFMEAMELIRLHTEAVPFYTNYNADCTLPLWNTFPFIEMTGNAGYHYGKFLNDPAPYREGTPHYQVYHMLYDMVELGLTEEYPPGGDWEESTRLLNEGKIGCVAAGSWAIEQFRNAGENADNIAFMPFPNNIRGTQYMTVQISDCYAVSKASKNKEASKAFVTYMLEESGFALDKEMLSIVKSDPYPDTYELERDVVLLSDSSATADNYEQILAFRKNREAVVVEQIRRLMDAAGGRREETFDDIMAEWNRQWEKDRPKKLTVKVSEEKEEAQEKMFNNSEVIFSDVEKKYLMRNPLFRIGFVENMAPLSYEKDGYFYGAAYEMCNIFQRNAKLTVFYYGYPNMDALAQALINGEIDMAAGIEKTPEYEGRIKYSKSYCDYYNVLIKNETVEADDLAGNKAAVPNGEKSTYWKDVTGYASYENIGDCIEAVQNLKADYTITNHYSANYYIHERRCKDVLVLPYVNSGSFCMGVRADEDAALVAICNKCIYSIGDGDMEVALLSYMNPPAEEITMKRFIETNTFLCFGILLAVFTVIIVAVSIIMHEKSKSNRKHEFDVKKYELLASLADEYTFEYDCLKNQITFDQKFMTSFGFGGTIKRDEYQNTNPVLTEFLEQLDNVRDHDEEAITFCLEKLNGRKAWYRLITSEVILKGKREEYYVGKLVSIQKEMEKMQRFQSKAERDPLTHLYNRDGFAKRLVEEASEVMYAVVDIDNFKIVNDTLGHTGGDYCLMLLAKQLISTMGDEAVVGRYGGDEFMIAITGVSQETCRERLETLVHRMDREVSYRDNRIDFSISLGAVYSKEKVRIDQLFEKADQALYMIKESGKNSYHFTVL